MRFATSRALLLVMFLSLLAPLGLRPQAVAAQDDAARFAAALASRDSATSLAGPLSGALTQEQGFNTTAGAGVSVTSFIASATFINPTDVDAGLWDFGLSFHRTPEGAQQVIASGDPVQQHRSGGEHGSCPALLAPGGRHASLQHRRAAHGACRAPGRDR